MYDDLENLSVDTKKWWQDFPVVNGVSDTENLYTVCRVVRLKFTIRITLEHCAMMVADSGVIIV